MGRKCSVPGCTSGYSRKLSENVRVHRFPKDKQECQRWIDSLPGNFDKTTKNMGICALHWSADDLLNYNNRSFLPNVPPSIFPEIGANTPQKSKKTQDIKNCSETMDINQFDPNCSKTVDSNQFDPNCSKTVDINQFDPNCSKTGDIHQLDDLKETESEPIITSEWNAKHHLSMEMETESIEDYTDDLIEETTFPKDNNMIASIKTDQQNLEGEAIHFSFKTEESNKPADIIIKLTFLWCSHCDFATDSKQDLVTHINNKHMKTCPHCSFRSMSKADITRHIECEHNNRLQIDCLSDTETDMDPVSACEFCSFVSYSTEHLHKHTSVEHPGMLPRTSSKIVFKYISGRVRQADYLFYSCLLDKTCERGVALDSEPQFISTDVRIQGTPLSPMQEEESFSCGIDQNFCAVPANAIELSSNACSTITKDVSDQSRLQNEHFISTASTTSVTNTDNHDVEMENIQDDQILDDLSLSSKNLEIASLPHEGIIKEKPSLQLQINSSNQLSENELEDSDSQNYDGGDDDDDDDDKYLMPFQSEVLKKSNESEPIKSQEENLEVIAPVAVGLNAIRLLEKHVRDQQNCEEIRHESKSKLELRPVVRLERLPDGFDACNVRKRKRHKAFQCDYCDNIFKTYENFVDHNRIHSQEKALAQALPYKCQLCKNSYPDKAALDWHMHWHATKELLEKREKDILEARERNKEQEKQKREAALRDMLEKRTAKPKAPVPMPCEECGKMLLPKSMVTHKQTHRASVRSHICDICGLGFFTKYNLKNHRFVHVTERPHQCHVCQKRFKTPYDLRYHIKSVHLGRKPVKRQYKCTLCDKSYAARSSLRCHMSNHTGEKAYLCNICGKSFAWRPSYRLHMDEHIGRRSNPEGKPHKCDQCHSSFWSKTELQNHVSTHKELPYKCETCQKCFRHLKSYQMHMERKGCRRIIISSSDFICSVCNKSFSKRTSLRVHERKVHKLHIKYPTSQYLNYHKRKKLAGSSHAEMEKQPTVGTFSSDACTANNDLYYSNTEKHPSRHFLDIKLPSDTDQNHPSDADYLT